MIGLQQNRRTIEVPCTVDIEHSADRLQAHVDVAGIVIGPGDTVQVHDAPHGVDFGAFLECERRATVVRATWLGKLRARLGSYLDLAEMFEVGYSDGRGK